MPTGVLKAPPITSTEPFPTSSPGAGGTKHERAIPLAFVIFGQSVTHHPDAALYTETVSSSWCPFSPPATNSDPPGKTHAAGLPRGSGISGSAAVHPGSSPACADACASTHPSLCRGSKGTNCRISRDFRSPSDQPSFASSSQPPSATTTGSFANASRTQTRNCTLTFASWHSVGKPRSTKCWSNRTQRASLMDSSW